MDKNTLTKRLTRIEQEIPKLLSIINAMKVTNTNIYMKNYEELSYEAAITAENIACLIRNVIFEANFIPKPELMAAIAKEHGITINCTPDRFVITLPGLMPKRSKRVNTKFLTEPLFAALEQYRKENPLPYFKECVVCFTHVYDCKLPARRFRDHDNLECKQIMDVLNAFVLTDDSGNLCNTFHSTEIGTSDCTVITIMEKTDLKYWLDEVEMNGNAVSFF